MACRTKLVGVKLVYCEGDTQQEVWVNINAVHAIAWCSEKINERPANPNGGSQKIPKSNGPKDCKKGRALGDEPICWWTGSQWVCGEE